MNKILKRLTDEADLQSWLCKGGKRSGCGGGAFVSEGTRLKPRKKPAKRKAATSGKGLAAAQAKWREENPYGPDRSPLTKEGRAKGRAARRSGAQSRKPRKQVYTSEGNRSGKTRSGARKPSAGKERATYRKAAKRSKVRKTRAKTRTKSRGKK